MIGFIVSACYKVTQAAGSINELLMKYTKPAARFFYYLISDLW